MNPDVRRHVLTWLILIALSILSFAASDPSRSRAAAAIILTVAAIKANILAWQFMELRHAHLIWKAVLLFMIAGVPAAVLWLR